MYTCARKRVSIFTNRPVSGDVRGHRMLSQPAEVQVADVALYTAQ